MGILDSLSDDEMKRLLVLAEAIKKKKRIVVFGFKFEYYYSKIFTVYSELEPHRGYNWLIKSPVDLCITNPPAEIISTSVEQPTLSRLIKEL